VALEFVADPFAPQRRPTGVVAVGDVRLGGHEPIRIQSMTTTDTLDTLGTVEQVQRLVLAGCEIVRITAPSKKEAENLGPIRAELSRRGVRVPLVADIHYTPNAAMVAAEHVEKIRINPGNYVDKKKFEIREYTDAQYREEIERAAARFRPLVRRCKELGRAMRIGTNHGSLADRIMNRYGDTPAGMVESALEFLDVCEDEGRARPATPSTWASPRQATARTVASRARSGSAPCSRTASATRFASRSPKIR
jgi:(E)-4-hydroxy-3-methylbut-2-enyl-diphosphate synthase